MSSVSVKVFLAVALGSFVGALVALQFSPYFWWLGLLAGGLIGYLSYQPLTVLRAMPVAARRAADVCGLTARQLYSVKHVIGWTFLSSVLLCFWCTVAVFLFGILMLNSAEVNQHLLFASFVVGFSFTTIAMMMRIWFWIEESDDTRDEQFAIMMRQTCRMLNPLVLLGIKLPRAVWKIVWSIPVVIVEMIIGSPRVAVVLFRALVIFPIRFVIILMRLIHSDVRLLCAVDAAIGAAVGYFTANALFGALLGGIFGVLNYLLSRWILHLAPDRRRS